MTYKPTFEEFQNLYQTLGTVKRVQDHCGLTKKQAYSLFKKYKRQGLEKNTTKKVAPPKQELETCYQKMKTVSALAKHYKTSRQTIRQWFKTHGLKVTWNPSTSVLEAPPKKEIVSLYQTHSILQLAHHYKVSQGTITRWFKKYDLDILPNNNEKIPSPPKEMIESLYESNLTLKDIAEHFGCSNTTVKKWFHDANIPLRKHSESVSIGMDRLSKKEKARMFSRARQTCIKRYGSPFPFSSSAEEEIASTLQASGVKVVQNDRSLLDGKEIDILIPSHKFGVEYDGVFWHSFNEVEKSEEKKYHLSKTQEANKKGITLFHIFENEWLEPVKKKIWLSMLRNRIGQSKRIYARKCKITTSISVEEKRDFLEQNHIQGFLGSSYDLGLVYQGEIVALMTFGKSRYSTQAEWELLRYCCKRGTTVVGGASRLLSHFVKQHPNKTIVSYCDLRYGTGNMYSKLGFTFLHNSFPNYYYVDKTGALHSRIQFQKHKLSRKIEKFDPALSEVENMFNAGYRRIWDCGNSVWLLTKS